MLFTFAALLVAVQASNLRNAGPIQAVASDSGGASEHSSDDVTQDSAASVSSGDAQSDASGSSEIIETQSKVDDANAGETGGVKAWAQCGGLYYLGETKCQPHTFCKQLSEFISVCFPESRPTEKVIRLEL